jgi:hypothetical protein
MLNAMIGSTRLAGGERTSRAANDSVMLCPNVKAVTIVVNRHSDPPSSRSPMRNST